VASGQFFSQRFGYGLHALAYVATKPAGELTTLPELAEWMMTIWPNVSNSYLSNVVQQMARGKLLRSHRGMGGGYSLGRAADKITVRDVVELLEGIETNRCSLSLDGDCSVSGGCAIQSKMAKLEEGFLQALSELNLAELAEDIRATLPNKKRV
jgi:Rrf2 family protein